MIHYTSTILQLLCVEIKNPKWSEYSCPSERSHRHPSLFFPSVHLLAHSPISMKNHRISCIRLPKYSLMRKINKINYLLITNIAERRKTTLFSDSGTCGTLDIRYIYSFFS